jgi:hypothetical protein
VRHKLLALAAAEAYARAYSHAVSMLGGQLCEADLRVAWMEGFEAALGVALLDESPPADNGGGSVP